MAQHEKDPAAQGHGASDTSEAENGTTVEAVHPNADDEAIFAPIEVESAIADGEHAQTPQMAQETAEPAVEPAPGARRKNRQPFTILVAALGVLATVGAIGAYRFRDKNEKLAAFADAVDGVFARPESIIALVKETSVKWLGDAAKPSAKAPAVERTAPPAPTSEAKAPADSVAEKKDEPAAKPSGSQERITWTSPPPAAAPPAAVAPTSSAGAPREEIEALMKRVDQLEQVARSALRTADEVRSEANGSPAAASAAPSQEGLSALEQRLGELAGELRAIKEKLDAPKSETRLPRDDAHGSGEAGKGGNPAVAIVIAHSLQKALERGAPFSAEYAALKAQGADPQALAALAPSAEGGASTPRQLLALFQPIAKQLDAASAPKSDAPIGDKFMHGVGKLVKVRPSKDKPASTVPEITAKIQAALGRDDLVEAMQVFDELPDNEKSLAQAWAEAARQRLDAERAAASILSSAIGALGKSKS